MENLNKWLLNPFLLYREMTSGLLSVSLETLHNLAVTRWQWPQIGLQYLHHKDRECTRTTQQETRELVLPGMFCTLVTGHSPAPHPRRPETCLWDVGLRFLDWDSCICPPDLAPCIQGLTLPGPEQPIWAVRPNGLGMVASLELGYTARAESY